MTAPRTVAVIVGTVLGIAIGFPTAVLLLLSYFQWLVKVLGL